MKISRYFKGRTPLHVLILFDCYAVSFLILVAEKKNKQKSQKKDYRCAHGRIGSVCVICRPYLFSLPPSPSSLSQEEWYACHRIDNICVAVSFTELPPQAPILMSRREVFGWLITPADKKREIKMKNWLVFLIRTYTSAWL